MHSISCCISVSDCFFHLSFQCVLMIFFFCTVNSGGGFWFKNCAYCGVNNERGRQDGFTWYRLPEGRYLQSSRMWLQCK